MQKTTPDENFAKTGLSLPPAPSPIGVYKPYVVDGKYLYVSGMVKARMILKGIPN